MIKLFCFSLIILSSTSLGFLYGDEYRKRVNQLRDLELIISSIKNEMLFSHNTIAEIIKACVNTSSEPIKKIFIYVCEYLDNKNAESIYHGFCLSMENNKTSLKEEDLKILEKFFKNLGNWDVYGQADIMEITLKNLSKNIEIASNEKQSNEKMYRYFGASFGIALTLVLL